MTEQNETKKQKSGFFGRLFSGNKDQKEQQKPEEITQKQENLEEKETVEPPEQSQEIETAPVPIKQVPIKRTHNSRTRTTRTTEKRKEKLVPTPKIWSLQIFIKAK